MERPALLDLLNVKYYLVARGSKPPPGTEDYPLVYSGEVDAYENPHRLPRAFVVGAWEMAADDAEALAALRRPAFNPRETALLCCGAPPASAARRFAGFRAAEIVSHGPMEVVVRAVGPGALVLGDAYYPGWRAAGYTLYRADYLFRGVLLPEGTHTVRFSFWPFGGLARP